MEATTGSKLELTEGRIAHEGARRDTKGGENGTWKIEDGKDGFLAIFHLRSSILRSIRVPFVSLRG
jgi:hypothetical protein